MTASAEESETGAHSKRERLDLLRTVAATLPELAYETWNFGDSVAFEAMCKASAVLHDPSYARFAHGWARCWATRALPYRRLDCTAPGYAMVQLCDQYRDSRLLASLVSLADYLLSRPRLHGVFITWDASPLVQPYGTTPLDPRGAVLLASPPPGVFIDCLHFDPPFLVALGALTDTARYWQEGIEQALGYVELLQAESGLFDHFLLSGEPGTFAPGWGRGQGWALLGIIDVLEIANRLALTQDTNTAMSRLAAAAAKQIAAMVRLQRSDGHWYAVVDRPDSGDEYSTTAFMAYGISRALRLGIVSGAGPVEAAARAQDAVEAAIASDGVLRCVSAAVMASTEPSHYYHVPIDFVVPWGQGPAVLALCEWCDVP